jgi:hypothetical protein
LEFERFFTTPGSSEAYGGVINLGFDWRPKSNVSVHTSVEATAGAFTPSRAVV